MGASVLWCMRCGKLRCGWDPKMPGGAGEPCSCGGTYYPPSWYRRRGINFPRYERASDGHLVNLEANR